MSRHEWILYFMAPEGHRYFYCRNTYDIAVADNSGDGPEDTDDGRLYLDTRRPVVNDPESRDCWYIPLKRGEFETKTPASWREVVLVATTIKDVRVELDGKELPIRKTVHDLLPEPESD